MDKNSFEESKNDTGYYWSTNLDLKISTPPNMQTRDCFCLWSDLLGFSKIFYECNWILTESERKRIYQRLQAAHNIVLSQSSPLERNLILNDGIAKVFNPKNYCEDINNLLNISLYIRSCVMLHIMINKSEKRMELPGCRSVLAFGENIEYLADDIRYDDYVMNYSKPKGSNISNVARRTGNPIVVYNPKELQMNTAFSKSYLLEAGGSKAGLVGNQFFVDESSLTAIIAFAKDKGYSPIWEDREEGLCLFVPYKNNNDKVVMGFCFDKDIIIPKDVRYNTRVYILKRYYPHDEKITDFYFDLQEYSNGSTRK